MQYEGGGHRFMKVFHKILVFFKRWLPLEQLSVADSMEQLLTAWNSSWHLDSLKKLSTT